MMVLSILVITLAVGALGRTKEKALIRTLLETFPPHEFLDEPLSKMVNNYPVEDLPSLFNSSWDCDVLPGTRNAQPVGSISVGHADPGYDLPLLCLNKDDYMKYPKCRMEFHNTSVQDDNLFLFRASVWLPNLSLNFTEPLSCHDKEPKSMQLIFKIHFEIYFFIEFRRRVCQATAASTHSEVMPKRVTFRKREALVSAFEDNPDHAKEMEVFLKYSPYGRPVERLRNHLVKHLDELLPFAYSSDELYALVCAVF